MKIKNLIKKIINIGRRICDVFVEFHESLEYGRIAENLVEKYYMQKSNFEIINVSDDEDYQKKEIDFILENKENGRQVTLEVKNATWTLKSKGTLSIEDHCVYKSDFKHRTGWLWTSEADFFAFVDTDNNQFYLIRSQYLRKYILDHNNKKNHLSEYVYDDRVKKTWVYFIPLEDLKKEKNSRDKTIVSAPHTIK